MRVFELLRTWSDFCTKFSNSIWHSQDFLSAIVDLSNKTWNTWNCIFYVFYFKYFIAAVCNVISIDWEKLSIKFCKIQTMASHDPKHFVYSLFFIRKLFLSSSLIFFKYFWLNRWRLVSHLKLLYLLFDPNLRPTKRWKKTIVKKTTQLSFPKIRYLNV